MTHQIAVSKEEQTKIDMLKLVERLRAIESGAVVIEWKEGPEPETPDYLKEYETHVRPRRKFKYAHDPEVNALADRLFISHTGGSARPDWDNIHALRDLGFRVERGEADSFSWLSGLIVVPLNKQPGVVIYIVFG